MSKADDKKIRSYRWFKITTGDEGTRDPSGDVDRRPLGHILRCYRLADGSPVWLDPLVRVVLYPEGKSYRALVGNTLLPTRSRSLDTAMSKAFRYAQLRGFEGDDTLMDRKVLRAAINRVDTGRNGTRGLKLVVKND